METVRWHEVIVGVSWGVRERERGDAMLFSWARRFGL